MNKDEWVKRIHWLVGEVAGDQDLNSADYIEVLQEMEDMAGASWRAKQEELDKEEQ